MKHFYLLLFMAFWANLTVKSQDIIVKHNNDTIFCKIIEVSDSEITYRITDKNTSTTKSINMRYVESYELNDVDELEEEVELENSKKSTAFWLTFSGGYSHQGGKSVSTGDYNTDVLNESLNDGFDIEVTTELFPRWKNENSNYGIALNLLYNNNSAEGNDIPIFNLGTAKHLKTTNHRTYFGPSFAWFSDYAKVKTGLMVGLGALHFTQSANSDIIDYQASTTVLGMYCSVGVDYKFTPQKAIGLRMSLLSGTFRTLKDGTMLTIESAEPVSASSWNISLVYSMKLK